MKNYILSALLLLLFTEKSMACAWSSEDETYYNLFNQHLVSDSTLSPFFLTYDTPFYGDAVWDYYEDEPKKETDYNILEWNQFFDNQISEAHLNYLVYSSSIEELKKIVDTKSIKNSASALQYTILLTPKGIEALNYLRFAKACEPFATATKEYEGDGWFYGNVRGKITKSQFMSIAKSGNIIYDNTQNKDIKLRTAYQLVRLSHYGGFNEDAIRYFKTYVEPLKQKSLVYYYALEQKAGALFNQKKYAEAGANYAAVFNHTTDRKMTCYSSFRISNQMNFDLAIAACKTPNEKAALYVLRGFNKFSNGLSEMKNIYAIAPNSAYLELMACRALLQMEYNGFKVPTQYVSSNSFPLMDAVGKTYLQKNILFTQNVLAQKKVKRIAFWKAYLAHLYLLNGNYSKSEQLANSIVTDENIIKQQAARTAFSAYMGGLKTIDSNVEQTIYKRYLKDNNDEQERDFVFEILAHNYILQNENGKAFLCHNDFSGMYGNLKLDIINDLIAFFSKENYTNFEKQLASKHIKTKAPLQELYDLKGTYYLKKDDLKNALVWFKKVKSNLAFLKLHEYEYDDKGNEKIMEVDGSFNGYSNINAGIFSSKVQTYFDNTLENAFTDKTYKRFDFIPQVMNKEQLVNALINLKSIANGNDEQAAAANFLLGNFYYNTSNFGYYRNFFYYEPNNQQLSYYYTYNTAPVILKKQYNYNEGTGIINNNKTKQAYTYFLTAEKVSSDKELKAKAVFQASKCELDAYFASEKYPDWGFSGSYKSLYSTTTRPMFKRLKDNYSNTAYYNEIKNNCNYFKYYLAFKL
ncbi:MAG TPA: hypothetical protein PLJ42_04095 [Chitinophagales bacterium]|jgi:hypothetical protein|nr:hypothetical protein [Chitinophagales bacterium]HQV77872.1 hypothetical protein [Chitinophagales bacterium]HQW78593.1 hypothetical protein [Chitinophagales bacterium]